MVVVAMITKLLQVLLGSMYGFCEHAHKMLCRGKVGTWGKIKTDLSKEEWHAHTVIGLSMATFKAV